MHGETVKHHQYVCSISVITANSVIMEAVQENIGDVS